MIKGFSAPFCFLSYEYYYGSIDLVPTGGMRLNQFFDLKRLHYFRKQEEIVLAFLAAVGFAFGIYSAFISGLNIVSLMRIAASGCVSIVRLLVLILLPFSFAAVAAFLKKPFLLYLLIFLK